MENIERAIEVIKEKDYVGVSVTLHLHYDSDEEYDYTGRHNITVYVETAPRRYETFTESLNKVEERFCRALLNKAHLQLKKVDSTATRRTLIHR